jgi:hypothetical protein
MGGSIDEEILDRLAEEEGVVVNRATRNSDK